MLQQGFFPKSECLHACKNASLCSLPSKTQQNNIGTIYNLVSSSLLRKSLLQESTDWFREGADVLKPLVCSSLIQNHINEHLGGSMYGAEGIFKAKSEQILKV